MTENQHAVLISGDWGVGKTRLGLAYSEYVRGDMISCDFEGLGQKNYVAPTVDQRDPANGIYYVVRLKAPTVYEIKAILAKIQDPQRKGTDLVIDKKQLRPELLGAEVKQLMAAIGQGQVKPSAIFFDTITRLCELTTNKVFNDLVERKGEAAAEKMSMLTWAKVKDDLSELLYDIVANAGLSLIATAWAKNKFDKDTMRSTSELIADVLKNVNAFVELSLMLEENPNNARAGKILTPKARILKSRLNALPRGATLQEATWEAIFAAEPKFRFETPEPVLTIASDGPENLG